MALKNSMMERTLINWLGLLGVIALLSYIAAVMFSPLAYPGYNWLEQAVSDLGASNASSEQLWGQLSALYNVCGIISVMMVCVFVQGKLNKILRLGIYLFATMNWISSVGYAMFPLSDAGSPSGFQNVMHIVVTALVVLLSIISLVVIMIGGFKKNYFRSLAIWATIALLFMFMGAIGTNVVPSEYFGIPERFSIFAATGFNTVLGVYLFNGFKNNK